MGGHSVTTAKKTCGTTAKKTLIVCVFLIAQLGHALRLYLRSRGGGGGSVVRLLKNVITPGLFNFV